MIKITNKKNTTNCRVRNLTFNEVRILAQLVANFQPEISDYWFAEYRKAKAEKERQPAIKTMKASNGREYSYIDVTNQIKKGEEKQ